jgi:acetaldehyde dehydrogenase/alcohol dehydrogenase
MSTIEKQITKDIDDKVAKAVKAAKEFRTYSQEQVNAIVKRVSLDLMPRSMEISKLYQAEFRRGTLEDKYFKIRAAGEVIYNYLRDKKTVGVIKKHDNGIVDIAEPVGVIAGILNCTGVGGVDYTKIINTLKTRNAIVLAPHPSTKKTSNFIAKLAYDSAIKAGAPANCIQCIEQPSIEGTIYLMNHPQIALIWATGGAAMVRSAYSSGKPALGVGPGNVPVYIDVNVNTDMVVESILISKMFDDATACTCESNLMVHKDIKEPLLKSFAKYGHYILTQKQQQKLLNYMYPKTKGERHFNPEIVGLDAQKISKKIGIKVPTDTKVLVCLMKNNEIGKDYPFSGEKLSPVLTLYTVESAKQGIDLAIKTLEYSGKGHSAAIHSNNEKVKMEFAERIPASRIVANGPCTHSGAFDTYNKRIPSFSVGCGKMGNNSTSQNIYYMDLLDIKRYSERMDEDRWYIIPKETYKDQQALDYLATLKNKKIFAVIDPYISKMIETKLAKWLPKNSKLFVCNDVEPDPSFEIVDVGFKKIKKFKPDTILAIGGGSSIDSAKGMWIRYEHPDINLRDFGQPFYDIFDQINILPKLSNKAKLIAIPTTCGTGSEATPFAVFSDIKAHRKYIVGSYETTPPVALLIPELITKLPKPILADTVVDALVHAIEAFVSVKDCVPADINSINAVQMIFENLPKAYLKNDQKAKAELLYAANEAGKAIANAFVGINHSLAHTFGAQFKVPHGKANSIFLIPVIKFNSAPVKQHFRITPYPNKKVYDAEARYAELARKALGIYKNTDKSTVNEFCKQLQKLLATIKIEQNISQIKSITKKEYKKQIPLMAEIALQDLATVGNPVYPSLQDLEKLFKQAYEAR